MVEEGTMSTMVSKATVFGVVWEGVIYGAYLILFPLCLFLFRRRRGRRNRANKVLLAGMSLMFCLSTVQLALSVTLVRNGFFTNPDITAAGTNAYLQNPSLGLNVACLTLMTTNLLVGLALMIYRIWVVYARTQWVAIIPTITLLGTAAAEYILCFRATRPGGYPIPFSPTIRGVTPAAFALPLFTSLLITILIMLRMYYVEHCAVQRGMNRRGLVCRILMMIVETGAFLPIYIAVLAAFYFSSSYAVFLLLIPLAPIVSITSSLMLVQARLGFTRYDTAIEHLAFTISKDMQFATNEPPSPRRHDPRPIDALFGGSEGDQGSCKDEESPSDATSYITGRRKSSDISETPSIAEPVAPYFAMVERERSWPSAMPLPVTRRTHPTSNG